MKVLKIIGIVIGSFIGVFALIFFLYPYLNQEQYNEIIDAGEPGDTVENAWVGGADVTAEELENLQEEISRLQSVNSEMQNTIDSLRLINEDLQLEIEEWKNMEDFMPVAESPTESVQRGSTLFMDDEEFGERVKSLLNLDEPELAPIVQEMDDGQLVRLYQNGGTIQREKLLRALNPKRAAKLMSEVML